MIHQLLIALTIVSTSYIYSINRKIFDPKQRLSSAPYLSADTFRSLADIHIDVITVPKRTLKNNPRFNTAKIRRGDIIYLDGNVCYTDYFFKCVHPTIKVPYILLTTNSVDSAPGKYLPYLQDAQLVHWFGKNPSITNCPKYTPIPLGLANRYWPHGDIKKVTDVMKHLPVKKTTLCYVNFDVGTCPAVRKKCLDYFQKQPFSTFVQPTSKRGVEVVEVVKFEDYLLDLARSKFVISPRGRGLDCHRHWEAMLVGSIPVIEHSYLDPLFEDLPVLLITRWEEVTEKFLEARYQEMQHKTYNREKLYAAYWTKLIKDTQKAVR